MAVHLTAMSLNTVTQEFLNTHVFKYIDCAPYIVTSCVSGNIMWQFEFHPNPASSVEAQRHNYMWVNICTKEWKAVFLSTERFF